MTDGAGVLFVIDLLGNTLAATRAELEAARTRIAELEAEVDRQKT